MSKVAVRVVLSGRVQGVGFRAWTRREALALALTGSAVNLPDGRVEVHAEGGQASCDSLLAALRGQHTPGEVTDVESEWVSPAALVGFATG